MLFSYFRSFCFHVLNESKDARTGFTYNTNVWAWLFQVCNQQRTSNWLYVKTYNCICFSTLLYLKFLLLWAMVILADFILEFRFEFLWPFWLLLRSVYDSFKYQGLVSIGVMQLQIIVRYYITFLKVYCVWKLQRVVSSFRPSLCFLFVLHLHQTWSAFSSSPCIGYSLLPALMFGCNMFGTQVCWKQMYSMYACMYVYMYVCQDIVFCYISTRESILYIDGNSF